MKLKNKGIFIPFFMSMLLCSCATSALGLKNDGVTVTGYVMNESKNPVSGVCVAVTEKGKSFETYTNNGGMFSLSGLSRGQKEIGISKSGYRKIGKSFSLNENVNFLYFSLVSADETLDEVNMEIRRGNHEKALEQLEMIEISPDEPELLKVISFYKEKINELMGGNENE